MEVRRDEKITLEMTPAEQGVHFDLLKKHTPAWMLESSAEVRNDLYASLKSSYVSRNAAVSALRAFKSPEQFCKPLLAKAMSDRLAEPFQVEGVVFQHVRSTSSLLGLRRKLVLPIERDLLTAACENFEVSETLPQNYHEQSHLYIPEKITGHVSRTLSIEPHEFAKLCRDLDLGKQYQAHVADLFGDKNKTGSLLDKGLVYAKDRFAVERHLAYLQKHISADVYRMLHAVGNEESSNQPDQNVLAYKTLKILGVQLNGPISIAPVSENDDRCVIYLPGDSLHPLKEYLSFNRFEVDLSRRLRTTEFLGFFMGFIKLKDRPEFLAALDKRLLSVTPPILPKDSIYLPLEELDLGKEHKNDLFRAMFQMQAERIRADARLLVIPTDDEDEKTRLARLDTYKTIAFNTALFFASFVPVVGEVMFAVAGIQLLDNIYEGISSWAAGDQERATDYLFDTIENLIVMSAATAGVKVAIGTYKVVRASPFIQRLRSVPISSGVLRLWNVDLAAYRRHRAMPRGIEMDEQGLVREHSNLFLRIDSDNYVVRPRPESDVWEVAHPDVADRYSPVLETNRAGAWRHDSELPQDWNRLRLFRRLGYRQEHLTDAQALQVLATIDIGEQPLRQLFIDRSKPMAVLVDSVRRFRADAAVEQFMKQLNNPLSASAANPDLQLFLLTSAPGWPKNLAVSVVSVVGKEIERYGPAKALQRLKIGEERLHKGDYYPVLLAGLDSPQRLRLLGSAPADQAGQIEQLRAVIAGKANKSRLGLFHRVDLQTDVLRESLAEPVREAFAGLPASVADELVANADSGELEELESGSVPLRLAEEARRYEQVVRLNRAYEGLYLDAACGLSSDLLVLDSLASLPGWPADVFIEIVEWAVHSDERASIGSTTARHKVFIEAYTDRFQALDADEKVLTTHDGRTRESFFHALWDGLPEHARKSLKVDVDKGEEVLRRKITAMAHQRREVFARLLEKEALREGYRSPMVLADRLVERSTWLAEPPADPASRRSSVLIQRARELFPSHSAAQIDHFVKTLDSDDVLAVRTLEGLRQQYESMRNTLEQWVHRDTRYQVGDGPRRKVPPRSKARAAQAILQAWRRESATVTQASRTFYRLVFDPQPLGDLPVIVADFRHVNALVMDNVGASAGLNAFLHNFPNLNDLSLTGNGLTRVPLALESMSRLTHLNLSNNQIHLTAEAQASLAAMTHLQSLNLSFNPDLGRLPAVTSWSRLRHLSLRASGISQWPLGVYGLAELQTLDLRDNMIATLPDSVFTARLELNRGTNVDGNPLSPATLRAIATYQRDRGISLGVITADYIQRVPEALRTDALGAHWVSGVAGDLVVQMQRTWAALITNPRSRDFFLVLEQMRYTADYTRQHTQLAQRVWNVLQAASESDELRNALFRMAWVGRVSAADASALFSDIEVRVLCYRAMEAARSGAQSLEGELIRLLRGLFRLQEVEKQALIEISSRTQDGTLSRQQALELNLGYRVGLAQRLDLPAQPRDINVRLDVEITEEQLDRAYTEVVKAENSPALLASIKTQPFWSQYLHTIYREQFLTLLNDSADAFARLEVQAELPRPVATQRMMAIFENYRNQMARLTRQLTEQALARHLGLSSVQAQGSARL